VSLKKKEKAQLLLELACLNCNIIRILLALLGEPFALYPKPYTLLIFIPSVHIPV